MRWFGKRLTMSLIASKEIVESPYEVRDIGIQVAVDNSTTENGETVTLTAAEQTAVEEDIQSILSSIVNTSISADVEIEEPLNNVSVVFQEFSRQGSFESPQAGINVAIYRWWHFNYCYYYIVIFIIPK